MGIGIPVNQAVGATKKAPNKTDVKPPIARKQTIDTSLSATWIICFQLPVDVGQNKKNFKT